MGFISFILIVYLVYRLFKKKSDDDAKAAETVAAAEEKARTIIADAEATANQKINYANRESERVINEVNEISKRKTDELLVLHAEKNDLLKELAILNQETLLKSVSLDEFEGITSEECKNNLMMLKQREKNLIANDGALVITSSDSKKVLNNNVKQILRCFNAEFEYLQSILSYKNIDSIRGKVQKSFDVLNKIFVTDGVKLSEDLLKLKLEQLVLLYAYEEKKELEKEQQKAIKEQMVEEEKVRREIEREKQKIEKEETLFRGEIDKLMKYMQKSPDQVQTQLYVDKIKELQEKLDLLAEDKKNVLEREQNTRAGFVYVISNIGSFGEDIYKIGMTRRLEPMDRIKELSSASVPFEFDVHAMIFSEDAPALEATLHQTFRQQEVNKVNQRKEFFKVSLSQIEKVVKENHNATVTFTLLAEAREYRESCKSA